MRNEQDCTKDILQTVSDSICKDLGIEQIKIAFSGKQPSNSRGKTLGKYRQVGRSVVCSRDIVVYKFTAKQMKLS